MISTINDFFDLSNEQLGIIKCSDSDERKKIYKFMNAQYPQFIFNKKGIICNFFDIYYKCYKKCRCGKINKMKYHKGIEKSNKDEYWSGTCNKCDIILWYEPNYDDSDDIYYFNDNNAIIFGKCIYYEYKNLNIDKSTCYDDYTDMLKILKNCSFYKIKSPQKIFYIKQGKSRKQRKEKNKLLQELNEHITTELQNNNCETFVLS